MNMKEYCFETLHSMYLLGKISIKDGCRFNEGPINNCSNHPLKENRSQYEKENRNS